MKTDMSSFDIMAMVAELPQGLRIKKVYQPSPGQLRIQVRLMEGGTGNLLVEVGRGMYISEYSLPSPPFPSNFAMTLRKYLSNSLIKDIRQVGFDRIVELTAETRDTSFKLICELFGEGNVILTDEEGVIKTVMKKRKFKHRDLIGKEIYQYPPQRKNPFELSAMEIKEVVEGYGSLVKTLASPLGLGGLYAEEISIRTGIEKSKAALTDAEADSVAAVLKEIRQEALTPGGFTVFEGETVIDVVPTKLESYKDLRTEESPSFNKALDEFFTSDLVKEVKEKEESRYKEGLTTLNLRLRDQAKAIGRFTKDIKHSRLVGDVIYANFEEVTTLIETVSKARKKFSSKEINIKLKEVDWVLQYFPAEKALKVRLGGLEFKLDLSRSASENADYYYKKSKKSKEKLIGARGAAQKTRIQIREYVEKGRDAALERDVAPLTVKPRKRKWFEQFRWFRSSEGLLVIGGRDATSNEKVVKRHMEKGDIFVHADIHGAPAVVVKSQEGVVPDKTIDEACQFAASNSTAWKANAAYLDVYWVHPDQVSKTPQAGEYVSKGAFIIRGKRNYRRAELSLSIGVVIDEEVTVMSGPPEAITTNCPYSVVIRPGSLKSKEASQQIKQRLIKLAQGEHVNLVKRLNVDEIQRVLPTGGYMLEGERR